jgi:hypothetical protein
MMQRKRILLSALSVVLGVATTFAQGAAAPKKPSGLLGDLVTVDAAKGLLTIRAADGSTAEATLTEATEYVRVQPGTTSLTGAEKITIEALAVGDRVWARGTEKDAAGALVAKQVVLMSAKAISERRQQERREWQTRGAFGTVTGVDQAKGELSMKSNRGTDIVVAVAPSTTIMRLKAGARDLNGAERIGLGDLATGVQIAVRGDGGAATGHIAASEIVTGTFPRPIRGRVASSDLAKREVVLSSGDGTQTTVVIASEAVIRKLTPPQRGREGANGQDRPASEGAPAATASPAGQAGSEPGRRGDGPPRGGSGFGMLFGDRSELLARTEPFRLEDLKVGDFVFAVADPDAEGATGKVSLVVKVEIPAGAPQRGPGGSWDLPTPPGADFPN